MNITNNGTTVDFLELLELELTHLNGVFATEVQKSPFTELARQMMNVTPLGDYFKLLISINRMDILTLRLVNYSCEVDHNRWTPEYIKRTRITPTTPTNINVRDTVTVNVQFISEYTNIFGEALVHFLRSTFATVNYDVIFPRTSIAHFEVENL